jgi:O-antigen/teichoic acid export membrane protein
VARTLRNSAAASLALGTVLAVPLVLLGRPLIGAWAGAAAVPTLAVLAWMGAWSVIQSVMTAVACFLFATDKLAPQAVIGAVGVLVNLALTIWWAHLFGTAGVIAATVVSYLIMIMGPSLLLTRLALKQILEPR